MQLKPVQKDLVLPGPLSAPPPIHFHIYVIVTHCHTTLPDIFLIAIAQIFSLELYSAHTKVGGAHFKMEGEPSPRWCHYSALVEEKFCVCGGRTKDFLQEKSELTSSVHCFDPLLEFWDVNKIGGVPHPGLYAGACASAGHHVYLYGGHDGSRYQSSLHQLDTRSWTWKQLSSSGPMRKIGCGLVAHDSKLVLFGGYGYPSGPTQPGAEFIKATGNGGWTNEVHTFDLKEGEGVRVGFTSNVTTKFPYGTRFSQLPLAQCHHPLLTALAMLVLPVEPLIKDIPNDGQPKSIKCMNFTSK